MENKYYLYRHIRLDLNIPFYIGIGTKTKQDLIYDSYNRAFTKCRNNKFWKSIIAKTDYKVEILYESNNYEFIKLKEIEFIALYGRKDLGLGTLVNFTNGGDGTTGVKRSEETKQKMSIVRIGKKINKSKGWYANKNMNSELWSQLKNEYISTDITITKLAKKYKYSGSAISNKFKKENFKTIRRTGYATRNIERDNNIIKDYLTGLYKITELTKKYNFKDRQSIYYILKTNIK